MNFNLTTLLITCLILAACVNTTQPEILGINSLSTSAVESGIAFTPDEKTAYVVRHDGQWGSRSNPPSKIYEYRLQENGWQLVSLSSFSSNDTTIRDSDIFINDDGSKAFFITDREYVGKKGQGPDIWLAEWTGDHWNKAEPIINVNSTGYEASPVTDGKGNLYFSSMRESGAGLGDLYVSYYKNRSYSEPELLPGYINSKYGEWNLLVSPKADWIIFECSGRPDGLSSYCDLYISYVVNGSWTEPKPLTQLNTTGSEPNPRILYKSGKLVYASSKTCESTNCDFYEISLSALSVDLSIDSKDVKQP